MTELTADTLRSVLRYDALTGNFFWKDRQPEQFRSPQGYAAWKSVCKVGERAGCSNGIGYWRICIGSKSYLAHRLAWLYVYGTWPVQTIDHINHDRGDNRIANLRDVSHTENHRNVKRSKANTSGVTGVRFVERHQSWRAFIWFDGARKSLGSYQAKEDAVAARKAAESAYGFHNNHGQAA